MSTAGHTVAVDHLLICGLGSIGRRHLRHFRALGVRRIDALRSGLATLPDDGQPAPDHTYHALDEALAAQPEAVVVCQPTALHLPTARAAVDAGAHVLVEKPLHHRLDGCAELIERAAERGLVLAVGCNLRFHPLLGRIRRGLESGEWGRPLLARAHFGAWLPDWHPWEDYREGYAARRDLGGGAALTHIHEIDYLLWLLGPAAASAGFSSPLRPLGTDVDETTVGVLHHHSGALSVLSLSLAQGPPSRSLHLVCEAATLELDLIACQLKIDPKINNPMDRPATPEPPMADPFDIDPFDIDQTYRDQAEAFCRRIDPTNPGDPRLCDGPQALAALEIALSIQAEAHA